MEPIEFPCLGSAEQQIFRLSWASAELLKFFQSGTTSTFCLSFSGCWRCNANGHPQKALPYLNHTENALCYGSRLKNCVSLAAMCLFHSYFFSHSINQCFSKWAESPPWEWFWWARGRKKQRGDRGAKMLNH